MNFVLPQFIEMEAKIVGPLTLKQFMYIAAGAGLSFMVYFSLSITIAIVLIILIMSGSIALAFIKLDGIPLPTVMVNAARFAMSSKIFLWKNASVGGRTVIPMQGEVTVQKAPTAKKIQMVKKGQIDRTKNILDTKR